jgi:hypothetical protein
MTFLPPSHARAIDIPTAVERSAFDLHNQIKSEIQLNIPAIVPHNLPLRLHGRITLNATTEIKMDQHKPWGTGIYR